MSPKTGRTIAIALAATGLLLSAVLEYVHVKTYIDVTADSFCTVGATLDCGQVALSRFSVFLGVPMPVWGFFGFLSMLVAAIRRSRLFFPLAAFSAVASVALFFESWLHVGSFCMFCEAVHVVAIALAVVAWKMPEPQPLDRKTLIGALGIPAALLVAAAIFVPSYWVFALWTEGPPKPTGIDEDGHQWIGVEQPNLVLHEFVDYHCPHCAISSNLMKMKLVDGASIQIVRRHQPRNKCTIHKPQICSSMRAAHCAGKQGKFWEMDSWLFAHVAGKGFVSARPAAELLGMDVDAFDACIDSDETWEWAAAEAKAARKARVIDTPTYLIDGKKYQAKEARALVD